MSERRRAGTIVRRLRKIFPKATTALKHRNAFELLVATILSAQTTDERVNATTPDLFATYPDAESLSKARLQDLQRRIRSVNFYRTKAKNLKKTARDIVNEFSGEVPETLEELIRLPGVQRKTANVVLTTWFERPSGIVVDTHVHRVAGRLELADAPNPAKTEEQLLKIVPRKDWIAFGHLLIWHGRRTCTARKPKCAECVLRDVCPWPEKGEPH